MNNQEETTRGRLADFVNWIMNVFQETIGKENESEIHYHWYAYSLNWERSHFEFYFNWHKNIEEGKTIREKIFGYQKDSSWLLMAEKSDAFFRKIKKELPKKLALEWSNGQRATFDRAPFFSAKEDSIYIAVSFRVDFYISFESCRYANQAERMDVSRCIQKIKAYENEKMKLHRLSEEIKRLTTDIRKNYAKIGELLILEENRKESVEADRNYYEALTKSALEKTFGTLATKERTASPKNVNIG